MNPYEPEDVPPQRRRRRRPDEPPVPPFDPPRRRRRADTQPQYRPAPPRPREPETKYRPWGEALKLYWQGHSRLVTTLGLMTIGYLPIAALDDLTFIGIGDDIVEAPLLLTVGFRVGLGILRCRSWDYELDGFDDLREIPRRPADHKPRRLLRGRVHRRD